MSAPASPRLERLYRMASSAPHASWHHAPTPPHARVHRRSLSPRARSGAGFGATSPCLPAPPAVRSGPPSPRQSHGHGHGAGRRALLSRWAEGGAPPGFLSASSSPPSPKRDPSTTTTTTTTTTATKTTPDGTTPSPPRARSLRRKNVPRCLVLHPLGAVSGDDSPEPMGDVHQPLPSQQGGRRARSRCDVRRGSFEDSNQRLHESLATNQWFRVRELRDDCGRAVAKIGELVAAKDFGSKKLGAPAEVLPYLLLGSCEDALETERLAARGVTTVINCAWKSCLAQKTMYPADWSYLAFDALDLPGYDLLGQHFDEVQATLDRAESAHTKALLFCVAGMNRSAALCVAYVMVHEGISLYAAVEHVFRLRPIIITNHSFVEQLAYFAVERGLPLE